jgi:hypothetical protein
MASAAGLISQQTIKWYNSTVLRANFMSYTAAPPNVNQGLWYDHLKGHAQTPEGLHIPADQPDPGPWPDTPQPFLRESGTPWSGAAKCETQKQ